METQKALKLLERKYTKGNIYVTTTKKLLEYYVNNKYLIWHSSKEQNKFNICITSISDPLRGIFVPTIEDSRGITFYTDDPANTRVLLQNNEIKEMVINENDYTNRKSIMIPLKPLPRLYEKMREYKKRDTLTLPIKNTEI